MKLNASLTTPRLMLSPLSTSDKEALLALFMDPVVKQTYIVPDFKSEEMATAFFERLKALSCGEERFLLGIYHNQHLIGIVNEVETTKTHMELGYAIAPSYHNQGFMTEALKGVISHLKAYGVPRIRTDAFSHNTSSLRVMEKCGMKPIAYTETIEYRAKTHTCLFFEI